MTLSRDQKNPGLSIQRSNQAQSMHARQMLTAKAYILLGTLLFIIFYWAIPTWLNNELGTFRSSTVRPIAATLLARRIHWIQLAGIILGFFCIFFAIHNYLTLRTISEKSSHRTRFNSLFTRRID